MSLSVALGLFNVTRFWDDTLHFMLISFNFIQRHVTIYNRQCWFVRFVYDTSMNTFAITMMCMAIERIISTIAVKHYEQRESTKIATLIVIVQVR
uniref:G protein-coupled receptor n=1 Tax=Ascaris lumbricoides TaxID=6252 RepID=A0A0M3IP80_ASCLU